MGNSQSGESRPRARGFHFFGRPKKHSNASSAASVAAVASEHPDADKDHARATSTPSSARHAQQVSAAAAATDDSAADVTAQVNKNRLKAASTASTSSGHESMTPPRTPPPETSTPLSVQRSPLLDGRLADLLGAHDKVLLPFGEDKQSKECINLSLKQLERGEKGSIFIHTDCWRTANDYTAAIRRRDAASQQQQQPRRNSTNDHQTPVASVVVCSAATTTSSSSDSSFTDPTAVTPSAGAGCTVEFNAAFREDDDSEGTLKASPRVHVRRTRPPKPPRLSRLSVSALERVEIVPGATTTPEDEQQDDKDEQEMPMSSSARAARPAAGGERGIFNVSRVRKVELGEMKKSSLDGAAGSSSSLASRIPKAANGESSVLRRVASITAASVSGKNAEFKCTRPAIVPEKLSFSNQEKFEGQMLINWLNSTINGGTTKDQETQATPLILQICTNLLVAGVIKQICDKDATQQETFRPTFMYQWTHTEQPPAAAPLTPGRLDAQQLHPPDSSTPHSARNVLEELKARVARAESLWEVFQVVEPMASQHCDASIYRTPRSGTTLTPSLLDSSDFSIYRTPLDDSEETVFHQARDYDPASTPKGILTVSSVSRAPSENASMQTEDDSGVELREQEVQTDVEQRAEKETQTDPEEEPKETPAAPPPLPPPMPVKMPPPPPPMNQAPPPPGPPTQGSSPATAAVGPGKLSAAFVSGLSSAAATGAAATTVVAATATPPPIPLPKLNEWQSAVSESKKSLRKTAVNPPKPMKPLFWTRIVTPKPVDAASETDDATTSTPTTAKQHELWHEIDETYLDNIDEFTELFSRQVVVPKTKSHEERERPHKIETVKVLEPKRSQSVGIFARSLHIQFEEIEQAIYHCDTSIVGLETLQQLLEIKATPDELAAIQEAAAAGDVPLDGPERFLLQISKISCFAERISCIVLQADMDEAVSLVSRKLDTIMRLCKHLTEDENLKTLFSIILTLGNYMNGGNRTRGQADGFGLEILGKLKDVKSKDSKITLLHFIVKTYISQSRKKTPLTELALPIPDPTDVDKSASVDFEDCKQQLNTLQTKLNECRKTTEHVIATSNDDHIQPFKEKMEAFLDDANSRLASKFEKLESCRVSFQKTIVFYKYQPRTGTPEEVTPAQFFELWTTFTHDFRDIWIKEINFLANELLKKSKATRTNQVSKPKTRPAGSLKERINRLRNA